MLVVKIQHLVDIPQDSRFEYRKRNSTVFFLKNIPPKIEVFKTQFPSPDNQGVQSVIIEREHQI